jgi:hypothetical protein
VGDGGLDAVVKFNKFNRTALSSPALCLCCVVQAKDALWVMEGRLSGTLLGVAAIPSLPLSCEVSRGSMPRP